MRKFYRLPIFLFLAFCLYSCSTDTRDIDGNAYKTIRIGNRTWTAKNLNVSRFRNGDSIPQAKSSEDWLKAGREGKPAWCYFENNIENGGKYGKLYNWYALTDKRGLAPKGWHVSTDKEWTEMINSLGGGVSAALQLRLIALEDKKAQKNNFGGFPAGCRNSFGYFYGIEIFGYWWSATELNSSNAWIYVLNYTRCDINSTNCGKIYGASVRCVKD